MAVNHRESGGFSSLKKAFKVNTMQRKTKIMCTIGPASWAPETLGAMLDAGMDAARINFSHGDREHNRAVFHAIRRTAETAGRPIPVMGDLRGPRIRLGELPDGVTYISAGDRVVLLARNEPARGNRLGTTYASLARDLAPGDPVLINDGLVKLIVEKVASDEVLCRVERGGPVSSHKGINLPGTRISESSLTEKDLGDLEMMIAEGFDFVALSFVQDASVVGQVREILNNHGSEMHIVAKIEKPAALDELDQIASAADGVLVARGDLGVEMGVERVPAAQKRILRTAERRNVLTVTATQLLESMVEKEVPTRAEASDVANAVFDGTDVLLFTGETAAGKHPVKVIETAALIAREAESAVETWGDPALLDRRPAGSLPEAICQAAARAARDLRAAAVVVGTQSGKTALLMSKFDPEMPVFAVSDDERAVRRMNLYRGVYPLLLPRMDSLEESIALSVKYLREHGAAREGDLVAVTFGAPLQGRGMTNMLRLVRVNGG